jgi:membrane protease YdiL (CAAX protease family)
MCDEPQERRSKWNTIVWGIFILLVALYAGLNFAVTNVGEEPDPARDIAPSMVLELQGLYMVGANRIIGEMGEGAAGAKALLRELDKTATSDLERLQVVPVVAELAGKDRAISRIDALLRDGRLAGDRREDALVMKSIYVRGSESIGPTRAESLSKRYGWFGRLALTHGLEDNDPRRADVLDEAHRMVLFVLLLMLVLVVFGLAGLALFVLAIVFVSMKKIRSTYAVSEYRSADTGRAFVETAAIFLFAALALPLACAGIRAAGGPDLTLHILWLLLPVPLWPLLRGVKGRDLKEALGIYRGSGVIREIGCGVLSYLAGFPLLFLGFVVMILLSMTFSQQAGPHPIVEDLRGGDIGILPVFLMLCVWAPLMEETIFRGILYHRFRRRAGALISALSVGFIFAVIHPYNFVVFPVLIALGFNLAMAREWRGSLIAPIVMHAFHNGIFFLMIYMFLM